ncbi:transcription factor HBP-1b(c38)-like isoform X1 [Panicum miliaceum]|uniref:Transcription factor HBP-1b(C38)-like isoform X1 n=1 Tax=Panicum miliaceum TaxID=4540 RepID=A0A3L6S1W8_PANMI|nr:transcription factor HBP-1b(c38)-like isoform X1 [Panicum miliaceum]
MAYPSTSGMVQASSSLHGSIRRDPDGYDMPSDLDQALLLYFDGQQQAKPSIQEQQPQTLNIFPSQPIHFEPSPKGSMASSAAAAQVAGPSKTSQAPPSKAGGGPLAAGKSSKAAIKREGSSAGGKHGGGAGPSSSDQEGPRTPDPKTLRRLAQNREAARKSRLRKKAYIQQLESGRIRLAHLEQEMQMARTHQGALWGAGTLSPDAALFNLEYERWLGDHSKVVARLRAAAEEHRPDGELRAYADEAASHYGALMGLKARVAVRHVEPLAEQQAAGARDMEQAARRAEEALDAELEALLRSLSEVVASDAQPPPPGVFGGQLYPHHPGADAAAAAGYMGMGHMHMALAMDKLATVGTFLRQADELRMQALQALRQILTARQAARCFVAVDDYLCRLRALSTLWTTSRTAPQLARGPAG